MEDKKGSYYEKCKNLGKLLFFLQLWIELNFCLPIFFFFFFFVDRDFHNETKIQLNWKWNIKESDLDIDVKWRLWQSVIFTLNLSGNEQRLKFLKNVSSCGGKICQKLNSGKNNSHSILFSKRFLLSKPTSLIFSH